MVAAAIAATLAALAGCGTAGTANVTVNGGTLTIYASAPNGAGDPRLSQDVLDAEQLALGQGGARAGKFSISFHTLHGKVSDNARTAIKDSSTVAYLGEIVPHSSYASTGITNALDVLQVAPTDTALELTQQTPVVSGSPGTYYESLKTYGRTFARVVPSSAKEARAQVLQMQALGVKRLCVADDGQPYGRAIALAVREDATGKITVVACQPSATGLSSSGADAIFYGGSDPSAAASLFNQLAAANHRVKIFGSSALGDDAFASALSPPAAGAVYLSSPGFLPSDLPPAGRAFVSSFAATYHHPPSPQAIFGYEAMDAVLAVLREAGASANKRSTVVHDFFSISNRSSPLGTYSIDSSGDTTLGPFIFSRVKSGKLVPWKFLQVQG